MRTKYDVIFENLQEKVTNGELTMEDAMKVNDLAYKKYGDVVIEEEAKDPEDLLDDLEDLLDDDGRKAQRGLVQQEQLGPGHEGAADGQHLLFTAT